MEPLILIADDDPHIRDVIRFTLAREGMRVIEASDGAEALSTFDAERPDLVILDVGMPEADGLEVCRRIRQTDQTPILFLSARDEEIDRVLGLEIGGDDYVGKPFSPRELTARVKANLKRLSPPEETTPEVLEHGDLLLEPAAHKALFGGEPLPLTPLEFDILAAFLRLSDRVIRRNDIADAAYSGNVHVSGRTIDSHVRNLRLKLEAAGASDAIETVHGVGFRLGSCARG